VKSLHTQLDCVLLAVSHRKPQNQRLTSNFTYKSGP